MIKKLISITIILILGISIFSGIFNNIDWVQKAKDEKVKGNYDKSFEYFEKALEAKNISVIKKADIYEDLINTYELAMKNMEIKIYQRGSSASYGHNDIKDYDVFNINYEKTLIELSKLEPKSYSVKESFLKLGEYYYKHNDFSRSREYLNSYLNFEDVYKKNIAMLYLIYNDLKENKYNSAISFLEKNKRFINDNKRVLLEIYFQNKQYDKALNILKDIDEFDLYSININKTLINKMKDKEYKSGNVTGKIYFNETPVEKIKVMLIPFLNNGYINNFNYHINGEEVDNYKYYAYTDKNGLFEFNNLPGGYYTYFVEFNSEQVSKYFKDSFVEKSEEGIIVNGNVENNLNVFIKNTFEFRNLKTEKKNNINLYWDKVNDADYYEINLGERIIKENGKSESQFKLYNNEKIKNTNYIIQVEEIYKSNFGAITYDSDQNIEMESLIPYTWIENPFIVVNAYDKNRNIINSTYPLNTIAYETNSGNISFNITKSHRSIIDLLNKKQYEKAINKAKDILINNPEDVEVLIFLAKIYKYGTTVLDEKESIKNSEKANFYFNKLYEITNDNVYKKYIY